MADSFKNLEVWKKAMALVKTTGSLAGRETQLILACDLGFLHSSYIKKHEEEITAIGKMLSGLRKSVEGKEKL